MDPGLIFFARSSLKVGYECSSRKKCRIRKKVLESSSGLLIEIKKVRFENVFISTSTGRSMQN